MATRGTCRDLEDDRPSSGNSDASDVEVVYILESLRSDSLSCSRSYRCMILATDTFCKAKAVNKLTRVRNLAATGFEACRRITEGRSANFCR